MRVHGRSLAVESSLQALHISDSMRVRLVSLLADRRIQRVRDVPVLLGGAEPRMVDTGF